MIPRLALLLLCLLPQARADDTAWPGVPREAKPWTRWWWLGSGVDTGNLTRELEAFARAGIGGVEICPIYGAKGYETRDLMFLSEPWTDAYAHTAKEAQRLDLGVDLTTGTGWPFGGPWVKSGDSSASLAAVKARGDPGKSLALKLPAGTPEVLAAWGEGRERLDLLPQVKDGELRWTAPVDGGPWRVHGLVSRRGIQKVKRAAPGGAGPVLDPFSPQAFQRYAAPFDVALDRPGVPEPRAHFHDSFEYYGAAWTDGLFDRFRELRGYDLRDELPAFHGEGPADRIARVRADYRATMSELHRSYLAAWHDWAAARGSLTRNQAHGSPGNLLDHYAVADVPETEIFRHVEESQIPMLNFAASAARTTGRNLVSAESFTWLGEHFQVTPAALKEAVDFLWLGGVNHVFFHGIPFSPDEVPWPGWLFYASTHLGPEGGLWHDLPAFNRYIGRVQTALQSGRADSAVLLYFPVDDLWHDGADGLPLFTMHNQDQWLHGTPFHRTAMSLWESGVPCDFVSDRGLADAKVEDGEVSLGNSRYRLVVVPEMTRLPLSAARHLAHLAKAGATVVFAGPVPSDVPGLHRVEERREELAALLKEASGASLGEALAVRGVKRETVPAGLRMVKRRHDDGRTYFLVNRSGQAIDTRFSPADGCCSAVLSDPLSGKSGVVDANGGIRLILAPGESRLLRTYESRDADGPAWRDPESAAKAIPLDGPWQVTFSTGGPSLPQAYTAPRTAPWTEGADESRRDFAGTAVYRMEFGLERAIPALLDLGAVHHTARVRLNGRDAGTSWSPPHRIETQGLLVAGKNILEVEVTNLAANRIAAADRRKLPWKAFHEINFVNIDYKPFDASGWPVLPSGLAGPVTLTPLRP